MDKTPENHPVDPTQKAKQETMKIRLFKAQPGVEQCYAEKQAQRNGEAQDGACLDITARSCRRWLKTQVYASAKRIPAKHNATPKKQTLHDDEALDELCLDSNASSCSTRLKQQK